MSAPTAAVPVTDDRLRRLTTADLAERLRRTQQTIRFWVAEEGLPAHRVNRRLYYDPIEVEAWLLARSDGGGSALPIAPPTAPKANLATEPVGAEWVATVVSQFTADDLRRAGELLLALSRTDHHTEIGSA